MHRRILAAGYESTVLDWFTHWSEDQLKYCIETWFADEVEPVIAISTPFSPKDITYLSTLLPWAKAKWPALTVINGGNRVFDPSIKNVDMFFLGRSMQIFEEWLQGKSLEKYIVHRDPIVLKNLSFDQYVDVPVVPCIKDDDFLTRDDILGFEIGVGCKFNCTFCNYELRGAKISNLVDRDSLYEFLNTANKRYGIENFFIADDTPNESDQKLEILADVVERLDFKPKITGFTRLDIFAARQTQHSLYERIQFDSLFFGIESFSEKASKAIRKKSDFFNVYDALKLLRKISPNTFLVGGLIVGLNGDSESEIRTAVGRVVEEQLLDSVQLYPLSITRAESIFDEGFHSDLDKNPEKFGYSLLKDSNLFRSHNIVNEVSWESDWSNSIHATELVNQLSSSIKSDITDLNHMEYAGLRSLGLINKDIDPLLIDAVRKRAYTKSIRLKKNYINSKLNFFRNINEKNSTSDIAGTV